MTSIFIVRGKFEPLKVEAETAVIHQGRPRIGGHQQELGMSQKDLSPGSQSKHGPADTLISNF